MAKNGWTLWFVGLHCSGKSTIAKGLNDIFHQQNIPVVLLDGDEMRKTLSSDLGYSIEERSLHMKRIADVCRLINDNGILSIACVASPTEESREYAKKQLEKVLVIYVKCSLDVCEKRDVKGHYKKARDKEEGFEQFLGVSLPFEEPKDADLVLSTENKDSEQSIAELMNHLKGKGVVS